MSITDPQFGEDDPKIGAIDVFGTYGGGGNFFDNLNDILGARSGIADTIGADAVDVVLGDLGDYSSSGGGTSLSDQIATEVTTLQADNALAKIKKELDSEIAKIQANTVLSDEQKKVRIAQLANDWLVETGAPNTVKAEVMSSVWSELGEEVNLTAEGYQKYPYDGASSPYGVREDEGGLIDLTVPTTEDAGGGGGGSSSETTVSATPAAAGGGGGTPSGGAAQSAQAAAAAAAAATANDPNAAAAADAVDAAIAAAKDVGELPQLRDTFVDPDGTVWMNTGSSPFLPGDSDYNTWRALNPSADVIAQYEEATGQTYDPNKTSITFKSSKGVWPTTGASTTGTAGGATPTGQTPTGQTPTGQTPTGQTPTGQDDDLFSTAASVAGSIAATVLDKDKDDAVDVLTSSSTGTSTTGTGTDITDITGTGTDITDITGTSTTGTGTTGTGTGTTGTGTGTGAGTGPFDGGGTGGGAGTLTTGPFDGGGTGGGTGTGDGTGIGDGTGTGTGGGTGGGTGTGTGDGTGDGTGGSGEFDLFTETPSATGQGLTGVSTEKAGVADIGDPYQLSASLYENIMRILQQDRENRKDDRNRARTYYGGGSVRASDRIDEIARIIRG